MAISPPSDLVLDVVRAANPLEVAAAQEKLQANRAAFAATSLAEKGAGFETAVGILNDAASKAGLGNVQRTSTSEIPKVYKQFESVVLNTFVKEMMPEDTESVYGKGNAGEIWKSMMAEQIGEVISERGGIGIAEQMYSDMLALKRREAMVNPTTNEDDRNRAISMITEIERQTLGLSPVDNKDI
ncbi:rod-binding protein [Ciceribacter sp. L1K23]|uniref:rod-binding protein n=1 Tax=Ciceribacter sp. L1K23 TaxID=2820276 RepID=UPI001B830CC5|nr:rod-binding protein [Ciceribacter sp. L1K23]